MSLPAVNLYILGTENDLPLKTQTFGLFNLRVIGQKRQLISSANYNPAEQTKSLCLQQKVIYCALSQFENFNI